jgi:hypothetical protein
MIDREPVTVAEEIEKYARHIPKSYQAIYHKAMTGKSLRAAINAKCQDCCCWQRKEVQNCQVSTCSLFPYRPYRKTRGRKKTPTESAISKEKTQRVDIKHKAVSLADQS